MKILNLKEEQMIAGGEPEVGDTINVWMSNGVCATFEYRRVYDRVGRMVGKNWLPITPLV